MLHTVAFVQEELMTFYIRTKLSANKPKRLYNEPRTLMSRFSETLHLKIDVISPLQKQRASSWAGTGTQIKKKRSTISSEHSQGCCGHTILHPSEITPSIITLISMFCFILHKIPSYLIFKISGYLTNSPTLESVITQLEQMNPTLLKLHSLWTITPHKKQY